MAPFPDHVTKSVQYGNGVKAHAVYLSQYQLIPYQRRVREYFQDQINLPINAGSIYNFNQQAHALLEQFEQKLIEKLVASPLGIPMKQASISMAKHIGCIATRTIDGHCFMRMRAEAPMQWTKKAYCHGLTASFVMTTENPITGTLLVRTHCVTRIIRVASNPEPRQIILDFYCQSTITNSCTDGLIMFDSFEMQRWIFGGLF